MKNLSTLDSEASLALLAILKKRFEKNMKRHPNLQWEKVATQLLAAAEKLWSLNEMEATGGEPDVVENKDDKTLITFYDCAPETPKGRRSICYDRAAWDARKENKPKNTALDMAQDMGIEILDEEQYRFLQSFGALDTKSSSWIKTPDAIRKLDGALFADYRYGHIFVYHNGASSYYAVRGFRGILSL
jgi:hypothetical protein